MPRQQKTKPLAAPKFLLNTCTRFIITALISTAIVNTHAQTTHATAEAVKEETTQNEAPPNTAQAEPQSEKISIENPSLKKLLNNAIDFKLKSDDENQEKALIKAFEFTEKNTVSKQDAAITAWALFNFYEFSQQFEKQNQISERWVLSKNFLMWQLTDEDNSTSSDERENQSVGSQLYIHYFMSLGVIEDWLKTGQLDKVERLLENTTHDFKQQRNIEMAANPGEATQYKWQIAEQHLYGLYQKSAVDIMYTNDYPGHEKTTASDQQNYEATERVLLRLLTLLDEGHPRYSDYPDTWQILADLATKQNKYTDAEIWLNKIIDNEFNNQQGNKTGTPSPKRVEFSVLSAKAFYHLAEVYQLQGKLASAEEIWQGFVTKDLHERNSAIARDMSDNRKAIPENEGPANLYEHNLMIFYQETGQSKKANLIKQKLYKNADYKRYIEESPYLKTSKYYMFNQGGT